MRADTTRVTVGGPRKKNRRRTAERARKQLHAYIVIGPMSLPRSDCGAARLYAQGTTIAELGRLGITLVSVDEPNIDSTAAGKLSPNLLGAMNQFFSDSLSERTRYRMKAGFNAGRFLHGAPIGYMNVKKNLVPDPDRAPFVQKAFELFDQILTPREMQC